MTSKRPSSKAPKKCFAKSAKDAKVSKGAGRPAAFKPEFIEKAEQLYRKGVTDESVAKACGVSPATIYKWKNEYPEFLEAYRRGRAGAADVVESSMFKRANGFHIEAIHFSSCQGIVTQTRYREYYPPDTAAAVAYLKANMPDKYREITRLEHSGKVSHASNIEDMSAEELAAAKERLEKLEAANG